ncbi:hypothetical protein MMC08_001951 [Hypocenomyce scalaris]|nr:hypothetical protein [Hypocenomyce scalaris]
MNPPESNATNHTSPVAVDGLFPTFPQSSTTPSQSDDGNTTSPTSEDAGIHSPQKDESRVYCCKVCEIEARPETQNYDGPDEGHPLRIVGKEANEEWFRIHCAPMTAEQQAARDKPLQRQQTQEDWQAGDAQEVAALTNGRKRRCRRRRRRRRRVALN